MSCRAVALDPESECESEQEIESLAGEVTLDIFLKNKYFDSKEFNAEPVKDYV